MKRSAAATRARRTLALAAALAASAAFAEGTDVVLLSGIPAPDGNGVISSFIADGSGLVGLGPSFNDAGQLAFPVVLSGTSGGEDDNSGLYFYDGSDISLVARAGELAPNGVGTFSRFDVPISHIGLAADGSVVFRTMLSSTYDGLFESALYASEAGSLRRLIRSGDPAPDRIGVIQSVSDADLSPGGHFSIATKIIDADPLGVDAIIGGALASDGLHMLVREGNKPPVGTGEFSYLGLDGASDAGLSLFDGTMRGTGVTGDNGSYLADPDGALRRIVRRGDPAPDGTDVFIGALPALAPRTSGTVAFFGLLSNDGGDLTGEGIYRSTDGTLVALARTGTAAPNGGTFTQFQRVAVNDAGEVAFDAYVDRDDSELHGIYRTSAGGLMETMVSGQPAPDGNGYIGLDSPVVGESDDIAYLNANGQIAVFTHFTGLDGTPIQDDIGILVYDDMDGLLQVVRKGDEMLGSTVTHIRFTGGLNDVGQVAYAFSLADGRSGLAIWTAPNPPSIDAVFRNGFN